MLIMSWFSEFCALLPFTHALSLSMTSLVPSNMPSSLYVPLTHSLFISISSLFLLMCSAASEWPHLLMCFPWHLTFLMWSLESECPSLICPFMFLLVLSNMLSSKWVNLTHFLLMFLTSSSHCACQFVSISPSHTLFMTSLIPSNVLFSLWVPPYSLTLLSCAHLSFLYALQSVSALHLNTFFLCVHLSSQYAFQSVSAPYSLTSFSYAHLSS